MRQSQQFRWEGKGKHILITSNSDKTVSCTGLQITLWLLSMKGADARDGGICRTCSEDKQRRNVARERGSKVSS